MNGQEWHKKTIVLFDLDGTLTDPGIGITNSVMYALKTFGIDVEDRSRLYKFIGPPLSQSFERFYGFSLKSQNKVLALATSKPEVYALRILEHFHLAEYFDLVCGSLLGGERTDKGEVIAWAMHRMTAEQGIEHPEASAVMVGDREHDMIGAKRNHIPAIGVLFGYGSREELSEAGAWELAETVDDLYLHLTGEVYQGGAL